MFRHGIGIPQTDKPRIEKGLAAVPGETYSFDYTYDTQAHTLALVIMRMPTNQACCRSSSPSM